MKPALQVIASFGVSLGVAINFAVHAAPDADPFRDAALAPEDVRLYLHVDDAASIRRDLADFPLADLVRNVVTDGALGAVWARLAGETGHDADEAFDLWLGRSFTFLLRDEGEGDDRHGDWVLVTDVDAAPAGRALGRLRPRRLAPRNGMEMAGIPEHALRVAVDVDTGRYVIGPFGAGGLFDEVVTGARAGAGAGSLEKTPAIASARRLGGGAAGLFMRHDAFLGGWSVLVVGLDDAGAAEKKHEENDQAGRPAGRLRVRHAAKFDHAPFDRPVTETRWDMSPLDLLEERSLIAVMEPTDIGRGPAETFAEAVLGTPLLTRAMRERIADCQILTLGEVEGRLEPHGADMLVPAGALAIKLKDVQGAERELDEHVIRIARALEQAGQGAFLIKVPALEVHEPGAPRHIDLGPLMEHHAKGFPIMESVTLDWTVARGPRDSYYVIATHPEQLGRAVDALRREPPGGPRPGKWTSCGTMNGRRVGAHLRTYADQAARLAGAGPGEAEAFRGTVLLISELASGVDRCRWRLCRPAADRMHTEIDVILSRGESAADREAK